MCMFFVLAAFSNIPVKEMNGVKLVTEVTCKIESNIAC